MERQAPPGLVPTTDELLANFRVLIFWRWITGAGVVSLAAIGWLAPGAAFQPGPLLAIGLVHLVFNGLVWRAISEKPKGLSLAAYLQIALDLATFGLLFHLTGGVESPLTLYLMLHLFGTGLLLSRTASVVLVFGATGLMGLIAWLEYRQIIAHVNLWGPISLYRNGWFVGTALLAFLLSTLFLVLLSITVASRLRRRQREAIALYEVAQTISSTLDVSEVLNHLLESCARTLNASAGIVRLLSADGNTLEYAASYGLSETYIEKGNVDVAHSPMDLLAVKGQPTIIEDVRTDQRVMYKNAMLIEGIRSGLVGPIRSFDGRTLGVLRIYSKTPGHFSASDLPFLAAVSALAGSALNNALQYQALTQIDAAKSRFLRTVTHELRAPVAGAQSLVRNFTQGFLGELSDQQREVLERIEGRLDFLQELITDLLDLAAGRERDLGPAEPAELDLVDATECLAEVVAAFKDQARAKAIEFDSNVGHLPQLWVRAERESLRRILANLVSNAIKYTPQNGRVQADLSWDENWLEFTVSDSGIGIPQEDLPHLFTEFYRAKNARQSQPLGTGLGLAIVKQLVTQFEGQVTVRSTEGEGSTFTVYLPLQHVGERAA